MIPTKRVGAATAAAHAKNMLFYSNHCRHCVKLMNELTRRDALDLVIPVCVDQRRMDPKTGQEVVVFASGKTMMLPPNINSVPALLLPGNRYEVILGNDIYRTLNLPDPSNPSGAVGGSGGTGGGGVFGEVNRGEPQAFDFGSMSSSVAPANGSFVSANYEFKPMGALPETYKSNKIRDDGSSVVNQLMEQRRMQDADLGFDT